MALYALAFARLVDHSGALWPLHGAGRGVWCLYCQRPVYGGKLTRALLAGYVEIIRGTPVLLQLFILYYGIAEAVRLPAFAAALLGLGSTMRLMRVQFTAAHWKPFRGDSSRRRGSWDWAIFRCWRWCADRRRCASHWRR